MNEACLPLETFSAAIYEESAHLGLVTFPLDQTMTHIIQKSTSFNVVKSTNDHLELSVELFIVVLAWFDRVGDIHARAPFIDECSCNFSLVFVDISHSD